MTARTINVRLPEALYKQIEELATATARTKSFLAIDALTQYVQSEAWQIRDVLGHQLDLVIDAGACLSTPTTVIDLTGDEPQLIRAGAGALSPFGLTENE